MGLARPLPVALVLLGVGAGAAVATDVPSSSGIALRTVGVLLEEAPLQHAFPQAALARAAGNTRLELEYARFRGSVSSAGFVNQGTAVSGVVAAGRGRFFLQHRDENVSATGVSSYGLLEVGAAVGWADWALGFSVAGGPLESRSVSTSPIRILTDGGEVDATYVAESVESFRTRGGALGLGWRRGRTRVDAVVRYTKEEGEFADRAVTDPPVIGRIRSADLESRRWSAGLRIAVPAGPLWNVAAFGEWQDLPVDSRVRRSDLDGEEDTITGRTKGQAIRLAARAVRGRPGDPTWSVQADWQRARTAPRGYGFVDDGDLLEVGVSHRRPLPLGLEMLAGWSLAWWSSRDRAAFGFSDEIFTLDLQGQGDGFSWGLLGRWERLEVAGVIAGNLALLSDSVSGRPFLFLDARLRL